MDHYRDNFVVDICFESRLYEVDVVVLEVQNDYSCHFDILGVG